MEKETPQIKRIYKDSVFRMLFKEKGALLSLYNAIYGTEHKEPDELKIATLENAIYMGLKNDVSCIIDYHLALLEHQSTINPNMPLRSLMYVSDLYEKLTAELDIYSSRQIILPNPSFIVLYNGKRKQPERKIMLLSDAYHQKTEDIALELKVIQLNINPGNNEEIVSKCPLLFEYIEFVSCVRKYQQNLPVAQAVDQAIRECISNGILEKFLRENRAEVVKLSIYEYDEEKHMRTLKEEGIQQGKDQMIYRMFLNNRTPQEVSEFTGEPLEYLYQVHKRYLEIVQEENRYDIPNSKRQST